MNKFEACPLEDEPRIPDPTFGSLFQSLLNEVFFNRTKEQPYVLDDLKSQLEEERNRSRILEEKLTLMEQFVQCINTLMYVDFMVPNHVYRTWANEKAQLEIRTRKIK